MSEEFSNQVVLPDHLPPIENQEFVGLERKYKQLNHIGSALFLVVALSGIVLFAFISSQNIPLIVLIGLPVLFVLLFVWRVVLVILGFSKKGYLLREQDVSYHSGLFFYKLTTIPLNRIQHVEVSQNMIEKSIGLSKIKIFTAGGSVSDLEIPGLLPEKAQQIESFILAKVNTHE
ncbi:MAG: PH domain-containing protein [Prolixibacteraceae bacterium]